MFKTLDDFVGNTSQESQSPVEDRFISVKQVVKLVGRSRSSIYNFISEKSKYFDCTFPRPFRNGRRSTVWSRNEVLAWMRTRPRVST